jgi:hypothetical protein
MCYLIRSFVIFNQSDLRTYVFCRPTLPLVIFLVFFLHSNQFLELHLACLCTWEWAARENIVSVFGGSSNSLNLHLIDTSQLQQNVPGYKSAIKDYHSTKIVEISSDSERIMEHFFEGHNRKIAQMKQDGFIPLTERKRPISFKGYMPIV